MATLLQTVFERPDTTAVQAQMRHVLDTLEAKFPKAAAHLDTAQHDLLAFTAFPREIWRQMAQGVQRFALVELPGDLPAAKAVGAPSWTFRAPSAFSFFRIVTASCERVNHRLSRSCVIRPHTRSGYTPMFPIVRTDRGIVLFIG